MLPKSDSVQHSRMTTARFQRPSNHAVLHPINDVRTPRITLYNHQSRASKSRELHHKQLTEHWPLSCSLVQNHWVPLNRNMTPSTSWSIWAEQSSFGNTVNWIFCKVRLGAWTTSDAPQPVSIPTNPSAGSTPSGVNAIGSALESNGISFSSYWGCG